MPKLRDPVHNYVERVVTPRQYVPLDPILTDAVARNYRIGWPPVRKSEETQTLTFSVVSGSAPELMEHIFQRVCEFRVVHYFCGHAVDPTLMEIK